MLNSIHTRSFIKCIQACEDNKICYYAQFSDDTCSLYKKTANLFFKVQSGNKQRLYERISKKEPKSSKSQKLQRYEKTQISGFFLSWNTQSEEACVNECRRRREICEAISFGENRCHLVKRGEYQLRRFNNWVSIYLENEAPTKSENKNSTHKAKMFEIFAYYYSLFDSYVFKIIIYFILNFYYYFNPYCPNGKYICRCF